MTDTPTAIATSEPATVAAGVFNNPGYSGPVPSPAAATNPARLPEVTMHALYRAEVDAGQRTLTEVDAILRDHGYAPLGFAPGPTKPAASPAATDLRAQVKEQWKAQREIQALTADPEFGRKLASGNAEARAKWDSLFPVAYPGEVVDEVTAAAQLHEAMAARHPAADSDGYQPAAEHEIVIPKLADVQAEAVARGEAQGGDAELIRAVQRAQSMLAAAEFCKETAGAIAADFAHDEPTLRAMDDTAWQLHENSVRAQMDRKWGDRAGDMLGLARLVMNAAEEQTPGVTAFLRSSGAGSHYPTIVRLAEHGARLAQRNGRSIESLRAEFPKLFT